MQTLQNFGFRGNHMRDKITITIPGSLPDLNTIIDAAKRNKYEYARLKQVNTDIVAWPAKHLAKMKRVYLIITWYCKDMMKDPDNIAAAVKFIWDGLKEGGILENDGWKQNAGWENHFKVDKHNQRVEIEIRSVEE